MPEILINAQLLAFFTSRLLVFLQAPVESNSLGSVILGLFKELFCSFRELTEQRIKARFIHHKGTQVAARFFEV